jgi:hypothetical protein
MRDNRTYGSEGGAAQSNESSLPLSVGPDRQAGLSATAEPRSTTLRCQNANVADREP